ncbi:hypothetical protein PVIIG_05290 [Plasmodium vivax India VII]|uniref:Variable surface protein Vir7-like protein n=1 Tax=Plasmodium vivax India VII TaxID=1077284 RepID=A0A0J9S3I2_PLAVI|nr:hypothetical protein PVIIG_05290 [Plasmodium vivax India VII]
MSELDNYSWKNDISDKLHNALCYVYTKKRSDNLNIETCKYLYYWLGSKIFTNLRHKYFFFEAVHKIYGILNKSDLGNICDPVGYNIYDHNFHKFKLVYDLSEDYETYRLHFIKSNPTCDKDFDDAIQSYKFLYKELRNECSIERTNRYEQYCEEFNKYFTNERHSEISSWTCKLRETAEQVQQLKEKSREVTGKEHITKRLALTGQQVQKDSLQTAQHSRSIVSYLNKELFDGEVISSASKDSSPSTIKKSMTSAVSAAGVSWINKLLEMNKGTNRNPYANQELMADFYQPEDFYSERNRYNIMYNPE